MAATTKGMRPRMARRATLDTVRDNSCRMRAPQDDGRMVPPVLSEGLRRLDSPTRALARRFAGALRSRGSLATLARFWIRGASPLGLPDTRSRAVALLIEAARSQLP